MTTNNDRTANIDQADQTSGAVPGTAGRGRLRKTWDWLDDRMGLSALRYAVPEHANTFWYTLGGITFMGIIILVVTGIWLAQYYNPDPSGARESVLFIQNTAPLGDVLRGIHIWTAYLVVITALLHLGRIFVTASYKAPREVNWLVGLALLAALVFGGIFTGTVLRWDQEAYEALAHNMELATLLGAFGGFFSEAFTTSVAALPRLYIAHVSMVPLILVFLLIAHIFLIKHHGLSPTPAQEDAGEAPGGRLPEEKETGHYPTHLRLMIGYGLVLFALAGTLGVIFPQPIGPAPNPGIEVTKPSWVFYWLYAFEDWLGLNGILYGAILLFGILALVPFIDRTPLRSLRSRPVMLVIGIVLVVALVVLSLITAFSPVVSHMG
ncbi:MAG TPA: cytochrome b N-terminal domain-containing protein [Rubrobacteraceae bacterium]|nr:cytochrome b N-terminal domain-containing protein [Rubrobacteraceae bacterium]